MILTRKQEEGLRTAVARYKAHEPYTCIAGYAGSGKSTLIQFIIAALGVTPAEVAYVAYTGKAATVLQTKGCLKATTAHKLLYTSYLNSEGTYTFKPVPVGSLKYKVIVVDEVSMLPKTMWELLLSHGIYVLATGDPGQLPPIVSTEDNEVLRKPHVFLDEIMRQAQDSEIIRLSMHIRDGKPLSSYQPDGEQVMKFSRAELSDGMYDWADQIICAKNKTRVDINQTVRRLRGIEATGPVVGDRIICLDNHWKTVSDNGVWPLTNGTIGELTYCRKVQRPVPWAMRREKGYKAPELPLLRGDIRLDDGDSFTNLYMDYNIFTTGWPALSTRQLYILKRSYSKMLPTPFNFDYAYAITCWKAQGSEYNKVLLFEEDFPAEKKEHQEYLYTGVTRAAEKVVVITP